MLSGGTRRISGFTGGDTRKAMNVNGGTDFTKEMLAHRADPLSASIGERVGVRCRIPSGGTPEETRETRVLPRRKKPDVGLSGFKRVQAGLSGLLMWLRPPSFPSFASVEFGLTGIK
jgi:hypothetical protein